MRVGRCLQGSESGVGVSWLPFHYPGLAGGSWSCMRGRGYISFCFSGLGGSGAWLTEGCALANRLGHVRWGFAFPHSICGGWVRPVVFELMFG